MGVKSAHIGGGYIRVVVDDGPEPEFYHFKISEMERAIYARETSGGFVLKRNTTDVPSKVKRHIRDKYNLSVSAWRVV